MFECEHCHTRYVNEHFFIKHKSKCKVLQKKLEVKSVIGRNAFNYYKKYLETKHCYNKDIETFLNSKYYTSFINFAKYARDKKIPDVSVFLEFVNNKRILPTLWSSSIVYSAYIKYLDNLEPSRLLGISILTLRKLSKTFDCEIEEVLLKLYINEIIELLQTRHLSPWLLLNSINITEILTNPDITKNQHKILEMFINPAIWQNKFDKNKKEIIQIRKYLKELKV